MAMQLSIQPFLSWIFRSLYRPRPLSLFISPGFLRIM